jgi:radical SAM protein with 4Fe4S-binding SPASM domain
MITNGLLLEKNVPRLVAAGIERIGISLDGRPETHDFIRNHQGSYEKAMAAARAAREAGLVVGAVTHVSKANVEELDEMYALFEEVGLSYWQIQITFSLGRMKEHDDYSLPPERLPELAEFIRTKTAAGGALRVLPGDNLGYFCEPPIRDKVWKGCFAGRHLMGVDADGAIKGCLSLPREFVEGNIRERSLEEIWQDPDKFRYNRYFEESDLEGHCEGCDKARQCRAGCVVTAYSATGSRFDNPYCIHRVLNRSETKAS